MLDIIGGQFKIMHHVLKVMNDKKEPIIQHMAHEPANQNTKDLVLLKLDNEIELWNNLA